MQLSRNFLNITGIGTGFVIGQGALLFAYAYLIKHEEYILVTNAGIAIAIFSLGQQIADFGGFILLARIYTKYKNPVYIRYVNLLFSSLVLVRFIIVTLTILITIILLKYMELSNIYLWSCFGIIPGLYAWSFNRQGQLDALNISGIAGILNALPWVLSSILIILYPSSSESEVGFSLGITYSVGLAIAVISHYLIIKYKGFTLSLKIPRRMLVLKIMRIASAIFIAWLPGQLLARAQLMLVADLSPRTSANFVLARNMINASNSIQFIFNRVEFPNVVRDFSTNRTLTIMRSISLHKRSFLISIILIACIVTFPLVLNIIDQYFEVQQLKSASFIVILFSPLILTTAINAAFTQSIHAAGQSEQILLHNYLAVILGICASIYFLNSLDIVGLLIGSLTSASIQFLGCMIIINRSSNGKRRTLGCL